MDPKPCPGIAGLSQHPLEMIPEHCSYPGHLSGPWAAHPMGWGISQLLKIHFKHVLACFLFLFSL